MQLTDLKSPGDLSNSIQLRVAAFKAIGYASIQADLTGKASPCATVLAEFFEDCAKKAREHTLPATPKKDTK